MRDESPPILTKERNLLFFREDIKPNGAPGQFNRVLMVRVGVPGDPSDCEYWVEEEAPEEYPNKVWGKSRRNEAIYIRFREYIDAYKRDNAAGISAGTPLESLTFLNRQQVATLRHHGVHNVEALAGLHDEQIGRVGIGAREMVTKAKDWIRATTDSEAAMRAESEKRDLESRLSSLESQWTELNAALAELPEDAKAILKAKLKKNQDDAGSKRKAA